MDCIGEVRIFSALDANPRNLEIEIEDWEIDKTTLTSHHGLYNILCMSFSQNNARSTFRWGIDITLSTIEWKLCTPLPGWYCYVFEIGQIALEPLTESSASTFESLLIAKTKIGLLIWGRNRLLMRVRPSCQAQCLDKSTPSDLRPAVSYDCRYSRVALQPLQGHMTVCTKLWRHGHTAEQQGRKILALSIWMAEQDGNQRSRNTPDWTGITSVICITETQNRCTIDSDSCDRPFGSLSVQKPVKGPEKTIHYCTRSLNKAGTSLGHNA